VKEQVLMVCPPSAKSNPVFDSLVYKSFMLLFSFKIFKNSDRTEEFLFAAHTVLSHLYGCES